MIDLLTDLCSLAHTKVSQRTSSTESFHLLYPVRTEIGQYSTITVLRIWRHPDLD